MKLTLVTLLWKMHECKSSFLSIFYWYFIDVLSIFYLEFYFDTLVYFSVDI